MAGHTLQESIYTFHFKTRASTEHELQPIVFVGKYINFNFSEKVHAGGFSVDAMYTMASTGVIFTVRCKT